MEINRIFSVQVDKSIYEVEFVALLKKVDTSFDTGLGFNKKQSQYIIEEYNIFLDEYPMTEKIKAAALKKYESAFMQRDIDSIND